MEENKCSGSLGKYVFRLSPFHRQLPYFHDQSFPFEQENIVIFGTPSHGGSYKITVVCLSTCPSVSLSTSCPSVRLSVRHFFRNGSLVFSVFCRVVDNWNIQKLTESFSRKIHFAQKWPQIFFFFGFSEKSLL